MTAEIAIMNKHGIALAADSAVTIETPTGAKIYNTNKLFMLSKYQPVGVMVFGNAELMGVPWEIIIKQYRKALKDQEFGNLSGYSNHFISFLDQNAALFPAKQQEEKTEEMIESILRGVLDIVTKKVEKVTHQGKTVKKAQIVQILDTTIKTSCESLEKGARVPTLPLDFEKKFFKKYHLIINKAIEEVFQKHPLSVLSKKYLRRICVSVFVRQLPFHSSGIVIAGFGENDLFPALNAYHIELVANDRLKYFKIQDAEVSHDSSATVMPFAQREMVIGFMEGVSPKYKSEVLSYLQKLFDTYPNQWFRQFSGR